MVFRKGGKLPVNLKLYYNGEELDIVNILCTFVLYSPILAYSLSPKKQLQIIG